MAKKDFSQINTGRAGTVYEKSKQTDGKGYISVPVKVTEPTKTNTGAGAVSAAIDKATTKYGQQGAADKEEAQRRANEMRTQGRKGCKLPRLNLSLTPDNQRFIKVLSRATGQTMCEFTNGIITQFRKEHPELEEKAGEFLTFADGWSAAGTAAGKEEDAEA